MFFFTAPTIYTGVDALSNTVLVTDDNGRILDMLSLDEVDQLKVQSFEGALCPGFINTHCHLELSYLFQKIEEGRGLSAFIKDIEIHKSSHDAWIQECIQKADEEMYRNGIVAVGDICNTTSTFATKKNSKIHYHNFIEVYAFLPERANKAFERGMDLFLEAEEPKSIVPHAPYSISVELMKLINDFSLQNNSILSIHNQESHAENEMFEYKTGDIIERFKLWGFDIDFWKPTQQTSIHYVIEHLNKQQKLLLVHNTCSNENDIRFAESIHQNIYWCICANANLYIENSLPQLPILMKENCKLTIGTDSLASNWSLSILDEWRSIQKHYPQIQLSELVKWSSINGAAFLGFDKDLGSIEKGKRPGLNLISNIQADKLSHDSNIKKII